MSGSVKRKCCCNGCADGTCFTAIPSCPNVRVTFAGTSFPCCNSHGSAATSFDGTYTCTNGGFASCTWFFQSVVDDLNMKRWANNDCTGAVIADHEGYVINVTYGTSAGSWKIRVQFLSNWFYGEVPITECGLSPITLTGGTGTNSDGTPATMCGTAGTATLTFCV